PTKPNYAWGGVEPNTFGTDEFIAFCRAVGCEPMICINAGSGTPDEAARWIEYCDAAASTPMGARRAANGHREPYQVKYWEVGNELWGRWQDGWTTPSGYADRYRQFAKKLLAADAKLRLYACGAPVLWGKRWNDTLIAKDAPILEAITDHPLIGGTVTSSTEPLDIYRDFMDVPEILQRRWAALEQDMRRGGVKQPRLAVTELQMFAHLGRSGDGNATARLTQEELVTPGTLAEALYDVLIYHAAARLEPFVELVTHSAIVNHGGGLRKERERVYANPCYYAQAAFTAFGGATPVALDLETPLEHGPVVLPDLEHAGERGPLVFGAVDALAAVTDDGSLLLSIVHRGTAGAIHVSVAVEDFKGADVAEVWTLTGNVPWAANSLEAPAAVKPVDTTVAVRDGRFALDLRPYTVVRVRVPGRK
ncbi:MAG: alpha-N-arabinofuranosidase, partial [Verrucomicrobia bacterium]|nr:alpha-N-arabinofuranosidase [Verrucomicrobiota bacterium]